MIGPIGWEEFDDGQTDRDRQTDRRQTDIAHLVIEIQAMIYDAARVRRLCTKFQSIRQKIKIFILKGHFWWGTGLDCGQYQILTDPRNGLKNPNMNFVNDRFHRLG